MAASILAAPTEARAEGADARFIAGVISTAAGVGWLVTSVVAARQVVAIQNDDFYQTYREGFTSTDDVCEEARAGHESPFARVDSDPALVADLCASAERWEIAQAVAIPAGATSLGLGIYLMVTGTPPGAETEAQPAVHIQPSVARDGGGLSVALSF